MGLSESSRKRKNPGGQSTLDGYLTKGKNSAAQKEELEINTVKPNGESLRIEEDSGEGMPSFPTALKVIQDRKLRMQKNCFLR